MKHIKAAGAGKGNDMWVSSKEIAEAKQYDLISYLRLADPFELVKLSHDTYCLKSHDSFKISNGLWHWFSQSIGGRSAIDYLIKVRGYSLPDAVKEVNRTMGRAFVPEDIRPVKRKSFRLPERNSDNAEVIRYLTGRGIDEELVQSLIDEGLIYESRKYHSAVFVGLDESGIPVHASYRSTAGNAKGDFGGSSKQHAFRIECDGAKTVRVFEGAIDLLSYITLCGMWGKEWRNESLISTAGVSASKTNDEVKLPPALRRYLEKHPETETVILHFDNDAAGRACTGQIRSVLCGRYKVKQVRPKTGKDYNEYLMAVKGDEEYGGENND